MSAKEVYIRKLKGQLDKWNEELHKLEEKANDLSTAAKAKYDEEIHEVKSYMEKIKGKLTEIQGSSEESWKEMKKGIDKSWSALKKGYKRAKSKF